MAPVHLNPDIKPPIPTEITEKIEKRELSASQKQAGCYYFNPEKC